MMRWHIGIWSVAVAGLFLTVFFWPEAASFEIGGRYLYMAVLVGCIAAAALAWTRERSAGG